MDNIYIQGLKLFAYHGVNPEEQEDGQYFLLDIQAQTSLERASLSDDLEETVSYAQMIKTIRKAFLSQKCKLIERASRIVAQALLDEFPSLMSVKVKCRKPDAPMKAEFEYVAVEINVKRQQY